jgi:hypothetical protein
MSFVSLTDSKIKSAISMQKKSFEKNIKLSDGGGLLSFIEYPINNSAEE